ncbi:MAG: hypothetical protein OHK0052_17300 [Anaerolineales bacterium]
MKTQVIPLEPHDDIVSVRDKLQRIAEARARRILLVFPRPRRGQRAAPILTRKLDLRLLQRCAHDLSGQIALVSSSPQIQQHAHELGIPVFASAEEAQRKAWRRTRRPDLRRTPRPNLTQLRPPAAKPLHPTLRIAAFSSGILALLALLLFLLPSAQIRVQPATQTQSIEIRVQASPDVQQVNLSGLIPVRTLPILVEGRRSLAVSGTTSVPRTPATGSVRLTNITDQPITLASGARLQTNNPALPAFLTTQSVTIPAGAGSVITVSVQAEQAGSIGNIPANTLTTLNGTAGFQLRASNPQAFSGGSDSIAPSPTALDQTRIRTLLQDDLRRAAFAEAQSLLQPNDLLLSTAATLQETLEETYNSQPGDVAETLELTLRLTFSVQIIRGDDLHELARSVLESSLPPGYRARPEAIQLTNLTPPAPDADSNFRWVLRAARPLESVLNPQQVIRLALGQPVEQAALTLQKNLPLASAPQIEIFPQGWRWLPWVTFRIGVTQTE